MRAWLPPCLAVWLLACSDYGFKPTGEDVLPGGIPDLKVSPDAVALGVVCGEGEQTLTLTNRGDGELTISGLEISGLGWGLPDAPALPQVLAPEDRLSLVVVGGAGDGTLTVSSDDPDAPVVEVPLTAEADAPPTVEIRSPLESDVLGVGATTLFAATVGDDADDLESLTVSWQSSVDGPLGTVSPDSTGAAELVWDAAQVSSGPHMVTATVTDSCGSTASDTLSVCQNAGYIEDSIDIASWNFEGSAQWDSTNGWVELTQPRIDQAGTAFQTSETVDASNVSIAFRFYVSGGTGADGMSLTALDADRMTSFVGSTGGGIGYAGLPGWSIEVDTWYNAENNDPTQNDHLSVHIDGNQGSYVTWTTLPEMEDGNWHDMVVSVSGSWMTVTIDGTTYIDQEVSGLSAFPAYVGFTAATGSVTNSHLVDALQVEAFVCE